MLCEKQMTVDVVSFLFSRILPVKKECNVPVKKEMKLLTRLHY